MAAKIPEARLLLIEQRMLSAEAPPDFVPVLAAEWSRTSRQVWRYVAIVRGRLAARAAASRLSPDADAEIVRAMILETYRDARDEADRKTQITAAKVYADVTGASAPKRLDVTSAGTALVIYAPDEREP